MGTSTTITESEAKTYMETLLGDTANKLGWSVAGNDFNEPVNEVLYTLDAEDFASISTIAGVSKVRTICKTEVWRAAMYYTLHETSYSAGAPGTGQTNRADIHRHSKAMYELALSEQAQRYPDLVLGGTSRDVEAWQTDYDDDYYGNAND